MEIVERLRAIPAEEFIRRMPEFKWHTFRAVTDNEFINEDMIKKLRDGTFASAFRDRGYRLLIGETENEVGTSCPPIPFQAYRDMQSNTCIPKSIHRPPKKACRML